MDCLTALGPFSSCDVSDALCKLIELNIIGHIPDVKLYTKSPIKVIGYAYTVEFVLSTNTEAPKPVKHQVDSAPSGSIIVIKSPKNAPNAVWGGLMTARAIQIGVSGVVIEGKFRDLQEILEMGFPVWAKGQSTMGAQPFSRVSTVGESVILGDDTDWPVLVRTGDIIVADEDGAVRIPIEYVGRVVEECHKRVASDQLCMQAIKNGSTIVEAFQKHRAK
jgi:regulator of RNase E activity RraA